MRKKTYDDKKNIQKTTVMGKKTQKSMDVFKLLTLFIAQIVVQTDFILSDFILSIKWP